MAEMKETLWVSLRKSWAYETLRK